MTNVATLATPEPRVTSDDSSDNGDASVAAFDDGLEYTLTVGQALERIAVAGRKVPSARSLQRYCIERRLISKKIRTSYGSEWLINEQSLTQFIEAEPIVSGNAGDANEFLSQPSATLATPEPRVTSDDSSDNGDASVAIQRNAATPVGETRRIADVLIENAKLLAEREGRDAIINELKEDRAFLREEVRESRRGRDDVRKIAEQMLDTLKAIAMPRLSAGRQEPIEAKVVDLEKGERSG